MKFQKINLNFNCNFFFNHNLTLLKLIINLLRQIISQLQTIVSRQIAPTEPAVVTVGSIHGGTKHNVIPNEVKLQLTLHSYTDEVRNTTLSSIKRIVRGSAIAAGLPEELYPTVTLKDEYTPAVFNNPQLVDKLKVSFEGLCRF